MRISGGAFGGMVLKTPKTGDIRPTQDRVREAVFNIIRNEVPGCDFLDLFAGSGAVGLEALSRGAKSATFVEHNRRHAAVLRENVAEAEKRGVSAGACAVVCADVYRYSTSYAGCNHKDIFCRKERHQKGKYLQCFYHAMYCKALGKPERQEHELKRC